MYPFNLDGMKFPSAEHYLMWRKARLFGDESAAARILVAKTPGEAQSLGRRVKDYDELTWSNARYAIAVTGSIAKFTARPELTGLILSTGDRIMVEASPLDHVWGCGLAESSADISDPRSWPGKNLLGFALMEARDSIRCIQSRDFICRTD